MKKILPLAIMILFVFDPGILLPKEKRGVKLEIKKIDGHTMSGELIAVKKNMLILGVAYSVLLTGEDVEIADIQLIRIVRESNFGQAAVLGSVIGGVVGVGVGLSIKDNPSDFISLKPLQTIMLGLAGGVVGSLFGILVEASIGSEKIQIEGISDAKLAYVLEELRKRARFPEYQ
jgi:hypothetical protein